MNNYKASFSIKLIYWLTNIVFGLILITGFAAVLINFLIHFNFIGEDVELHILLPAKVEFMETGTLSIRNEIINVELVDATPRIHFIDTPTYITKYIATTLLLILAWAIFEVYIFRQFIKNVYRGNIFTFKNIQLLKKLAYGLLGLWIFGVFYFNLGYHILAKNLTFENAKITDESPNFSGVLLTALLVWVLAHIFKKGLELKQESDLTI